MEENGTYGAVGVLWNFSWSSVEVFSVGGSIGIMTDGSARGGRLWVWVEMRIYMFVIYI